MTSWLEHREDSAGSRTCWWIPCASDMLEVSEHRRSIGRVPCAVRELVQGMSDRTRAREAWKPQSKTFSRSRCTARDRQRGLTAFIRSRAHGRRPRGRIQCMRGGSRAALQERERESRKTQPLSQCHGRSVRMRRTIEAVSGPVRGSSGLGCPYRERTSHAAGDEAQRETDISAEHCWKVK